MNSVVKSAFSDMGFKNMNNGVSDLFEAPRVHVLDVRKRRVNRHSKTAAFSTHVDESRLWVDDAVRANDFDDVPQKPHVLVEFLTHRKDEMAVARAASFAGQKRLSHLSLLVATETLAHFEGPVSAAQLAGNNG